MSEFEKYIRDEQRKFDLDKINPKIWEGIESGFNEKKTRILPFRKAALGLVAAVLIGVFCFQWFGNQQDIEFPQHLLADYGFKEANVSELLNTKINTIRQASVPVAYKSDLEMLLEQVNSLDEHFVGKINKLTSGDIDTELSTEILEYYKTKSEILDRVIIEIQKINSNEEEYKIKSEKASIQI